MKKFMVRLVVGFGLVVLFSQAASAQWVQTNGPMGGRINALAGSGTAIFAGTDSGVFRSTNNGTQWIAVNNGFPTMYPIYYKKISSLAVSGSAIYAGTYGVYFSTNNGTSWAKTDSGLLPTINSLVTNDSFLLACSLQHDMGAGGGEYWGYIYISSINDKKWPQVLNDHSVSSITLAGSGSTFYAITSPIDNMANWVIPQDTSSDFLFSTDNGNNWTEVHGSLHARGMSLMVKNDSIFAGTYLHGVLLSTDNGASWTPINSGLPDSTSVNSFVASGSTIFAGTSKGVFSSTNNGMNWTAFNTGLKSLEVRSLAIIGNTIFAGTDSNGVWRRPLSEMVEVTNHNSQRGMLSQANLKIFSPSNTNHSATIEFSLPHSDRVTATVYDLSGHEIASLVDKQLGSGPHSVTWDTRNRAPGCYAVRMRLGAKTYIQSLPVFR